MLLSPGHGGSIALLLPSLEPQLGAAVEGWEDEEVDYGDGESSTGVVGGTGRNGVEFKREDRLGVVNGASEDENLFSKIDF